jgi:hypothetical protein
MTLWVDVARVAIVLNLLLLGGLVSVWGRNYWQLRSKHALGLALFGLLLLLENGFALYFYFLDPVLRVWVTSIPSVAQVAMTVLRVLETGGLAVLSWVTWD